MSSILLAGLTEPEAAALEILVGMHWRDWKVVTLKRSLSLSIPEQTSAARAADVCVVDLFGFGMRRHAPEQEARLMEFLNGRSAILLAWGTGGGWNEAELPTAPGQQVECLKVPYTSVAIRSALNGILTGEKKTGRAPAKSPDAAAMPLPAARKSPAASAAPELEEKPQEQPVGEVDALRVLHAAFPQLASSLLVKLVGKITQPGSAYLVHSRGDPVFISNAAQGTAASPSSEAAMLKALLTPEVQSSLRLVPIALDKFEESQRKYIRTPLRQQKSLDVFAWELAENALADLKLTQKADLSLRLTRMPNFTLMGGGNAMDVQLAAICIRKPYSINTLVQSFPRQEDKVFRFAALAILSGLAEITQAPPVQPRKVVLAAPRAAAPVAPPKGFFRSLLSKLF